MGRGLGQVQPPYDSSQQIAPSSWWSTAGCRGLALDFFGCSLLAVAGFQCWFGWLLLPLRHPHIWLTGCWTDRTVAVLCAVQSLLVEVRGPVCPHPSEAKQSTHKPGSDMYGCRVHPSLHSPPSHSVHLLPFSSCFYSTPFPPQSHPSFRLFLPVLPFNSFQLDCDHRKSPWEPALTRTSESLSCLLRTAASDLLCIEISRPPPKSQFTVLLNPPTFPFFPTDPTKKRCQLINSTTKRRQELRLGVAKPLTSHCTKKENRLPDSPKRKHSRDFSRVETSCKQSPKFRHTSSLQPNILALR